MAGQPRSDSRREDGAAESGPTSKSVLIVEDDFLIALNAELALKDAGYEPIGPVRDEAKAIEVALSEKPDIVLLDLHLANGGSGQRVAEKVAQATSTAIIFMSGNLTPDMRKALAVFEPAGMVGKPYSDAQLLRAVQEAA